MNLNNWHQHRISKLIVKKLFGTVTGKKMFILGFSFKANTNDTRESSAINICKDLLDEGATLYIHDPKVSPNQIAKDLSIPKATDLNLNEGEWCFIDNLDEGFKNADAVIILTEWSEYKSLNWTEIAKEMRDHGWVFDTRSLISERTIAGSKLNLWRIGDGSKV